MLTEYHVEEMVEETRQKVEAVPTAKAALATLKRAGVNERAILQMIFQYCGKFPTVRSGKKRIDVGAHEASELRKRMRNMAAKLKSVGNEYAGLLNDIGEATPFKYHSKLPLELRREADHFTKLLGLISKGRSGRGGRNSSLFALVRLIKIATGSERDAYYKEISELVNAVSPEQTTTGSRKRKRRERFDDGTAGKSERALEKAAKYFEKHYPDAAALITDEARDEIERWTTLHSLMPLPTQSPSVQSAMLSDQTTQESKALAGKQVNGSSDTKTS